MKKFLSTFFGSLAVSLCLAAFAQAQPLTVNGDLSKAAYTTLATKQNTNSGFGANIDVSKIVYYIDAVNSQLYVGVVGKLDVGSNNAIGLWLGFSQVSGIAAGSSLGGITSSGGYISDTGNPNYKADFNVAYEFAINPGTSSSNAYINAAKVVGTPVGSYLGNCGQSGSSISVGSTGGGDNSIFTSNVVTAFNNSGAANQGWEMKIPFSELGITAAGTVRAFAFVTSGNAYFSDVTVPGNVTGGNLGFNANFSTQAGGPYNTGAATLPVELSGFTASAANGRVMLAWTTATEKNNSGFMVERSTDNQAFTSLGFVRGNGTTTQAKSYSFTDATASGKVYYRLKQTDYDGKFQYSNTIEAVVTLPVKYELAQNYPNPFNPTTNISFTLAKDENVSLKVYDIVGREVASLLSNTPTVRGMHSVTFDATKLASGIYLYKLQAGNFVSLRKMVLVK